MQGGEAEMLPSSVLLILGKVAVNVEDVVQDWKKKKKISAPQNMEEPSEAQPHRMQDSKKLNDLVSKCKMQIKEL